MYNHVMCYLQLYLWKTGRLWPYGESRRPPTSPWRSRVRPTAARRYGAIRAGAIKAGDLLTAGGKTFEVSLAVQTMPGTRVGSCKGLGVVGRGHVSLWTNLDTWHSKLVRDIGYL